ncbi:MAG: flavodoxin family protein [Clostridiales bacterium]|jgi:multimeric flavodoxin WrbA|nr:flavodoxin family protein [Clostridiales bacterium]
MKILIINGSPRTNGATGQILSKISETIAAMDAGAEIEYVELAKINMKFCIGCASCYISGKCPVDDDLETLSKKIEACDGLILGSPTYASNVSGQFKILIDRGHFVFEQLLKNKACFSVVTYENYGGKKALAIINDLICKSGGAVSAKYMLKLNHNSEALNEKRIRKTEKLCRKFISKAKKKNPLSLFERISSFIIFHAGIKPHVIKNKLRYQGILNRWEKNVLK